MKIAFLVTDLGLSGGMNVILHHAKNLSEEHHHEVHLVSETISEPNWAESRLDSFKISKLEDALNEHFDLVIATFWSSLLQVPRLNFNNLAWFCQSLEDRFYSENDPHRGLAQDVIRMNIPVVTEATWIKELLTKINPSNQIYLVKNGVDKEVFHPVNRNDSDSEPLRILIEGPYASLTKGIRLALEGALGASEPVSIRHITRDNRFIPRDNRYTALIQEFTLEEMASHYSWCDVIIKTSTVEGMFGPPLEAFHCGATAIVTPVTGYDEYIKPSYNSLVTSWEDPKGLSNLIDGLARDRNQLASLKKGASKTADDWINWEESTRKFNEAINKICSKEMNNELIQQLCEYELIAESIGKNTDKHNLVISGLGVFKRIINSDLKFWFNRFKEDPFATAKRAILILYFSFTAKIKGK